MVEIIRSEMSQINTKVFGFDSKLSEAKELLIIGLVDRVLSVIHAMEFDGHERPRWVVRFCGDYKQGFTDLESAQKYAQDFLNKRKGLL